MHFYRLRFKNTVSLCLFLLKMLVFSAVVVCWQPGDPKHVQRLDFPLSTKPNIKNVALTLFQSSAVAIFTLDK